MRLWRQPSDKPGEWWNHSYFFFVQISDLILLKVSAFTKLKDVVHITETFFILPFTKLVVDPCMHPLTGSSIMHPDAEATTFTCATRGYSRPDADAPGGRRKRARAEKRFGPNRMGLKYSNTNYGWFYE